MRKPNTIEDDLDKIRVEIYEEIKDLSREEYLEYFRKFGEEVTKKYGIKISKPLNSKGNTNDHMK
jgi:hemerythrin-like domain-containing protein